MHLLFTQVHFFFWQLGRVGGQYATMIFGWLFFMSSPFHSTDFLQFCHENWLPFRPIWVFKNLFCCTFSIFNIYCFDFSIKTLWFLSSSTEMCSFLKPPFFKYIYTNLFCVDLHFLFSRHIQTLWFLSSSTRMFSFFFKPSHFFYICSKI